VFEAGGEISSPTPNRIVKSFLTHAGKLSHSFVSTGEFVLSNP